MRDEHLANSMTGREELQRIARMVDIHRQKMERIEEQLTRLESIHLEQGQVVRAMREIPEGGMIGAMIPLGSGVQLMVDIPKDSGAVVDIGTAVQAEMTRGQAADLIEERQTEINTLIESLKKEFDSAELTVRELAETFNQGVAAMEEKTPPEQEAPTTPPSQEKVSTEVDEETTERPRRRRRGIGSELTLDD
jgi:prefoldin alpha subunit